MKLTRFLKFAIASSVVAMLLVLCFPIWKIDLIAPQYPEGLVLKIWAHKLSGNVDTINGLNHYIGMKKLHTEDFIEFKILPYLIIGLAVLGLLVILLNRIIWLRAYAVLFILISMVCLADFYRWNYDYGHSLDPNAPIQVPGMAYQPPIIGHKQLLNFSVASFPDVGGYIYILCGVIIVGSAVIDWWKKYNRRLLE